MLNQPDLSALNKNDPVDHFLLVRKIESRLTKTNKPYLFMELGDKSLTLSANLWDNFDEISSSIAVGNIVKVIGIIEDYQGMRQIRIGSIRKSIANDSVGGIPSEEISSMDFLPKSKRNLDVMLAEFTKRIEKIKDSFLKQLLKQIFSEENLKKFSTAPAGKSWHHSYLHGLIEHTLEIIKICDLMCDIHPEINRDLLITGAMMHDFGKTEELSFNNSFEYTDKGKLLGHIVISAMLINEEAKKIPFFPGDIKNCLIHLVLSHQGRLEYASPVVPKTLEAIALYQADELSAKVNAYKNVILSQVNSESKWTKYITLASTDLFKYGLSPDKEEEINKSLFD
ncbi:MAG: 3'-5' exoribonuclease YhaM family protein [Ignavibacteriaceae bacterium]